MDQRFVNLRIPAGGNDTVPAEIEVSGGRIERLIRASGSVADVAAGGAKTTNLGGALVLPGAIDGHVHFDDPGFTHREDFATGTRAAAAGGVTCVVDMPCTSLPPVTSAANLNAKLEVIAPKAHVDFMLWGGVSGSVVRERRWREQLAELVGEGVAAIKVYMLSGMETFRDLAPGKISEVLVQTERLGIPVGVHAEDHDLVHEITESFRAEGKDGALAYAESRPPECEIRAVTTMRDLCVRTGARVHIVHLATGAALDIVTAAREDGVPISAETCPQYLEFTVDDLDRKGALLKTAPVVKSAADRDRLWEGLASGEIQHVATDHAAGQWPEEKTTGSIWTDYGGIPGVELMVPYLYSEGVRRGRITLERFVDLISGAPARFFGVEARKGALEAGRDADLVVIDEHEEWVVQSEGLHNLNRYTPLAGRKLTGRVRATYVRGERVFARDGASMTFGAAGHGRFTARAR